MDPLESESSFAPERIPPKDPLFEQQIHRLHRFSVYGRWGVVLICWLLFAPLSLWALQDELALWRDYFTWTAVRYSLAFNPWATLGLGICIGITLATLVWQSRNILWGLPKHDRQRLEQEVLRIRRQGKRHPLWRWVCR